jgi:hypothetical protein
MGPPFFPQDGWQRTNTIQLDFQDSYMSQLPRRKRACY